MSKLILRSQQSPGDIVMLTAAVRDLKGTLGAEVEIDVRTPCPALWENQPGDRGRESGVRGQESANECRVLE